MKKILDACCGSRMFYFDREDPDVIYADNREIETTLCDGRKLLIKPDVQMDFRNMPYKDNSFKVVVFDPPHLEHAGTGSWLGLKYGILPEDWPEYLKAGFDECIRVLEPDGLLVFKWNEDQIPLVNERLFRPDWQDRREKARSFRVSNLKQTTGPNTFECPTCKKTIIYLDDKYRHKHCLNCGQAFKW